MIVFKLVNSKKFKERSAWAYIYKNKFFFSGRNDGEVNAYSTRSYMGIFRYQLAERPSSGRSPLNEFKQDLINFKLADNIIADII